MKNTLFFMFALILLATQSGCERTRHFDIAVGNRLDSAIIMVNVDGRDIGTVDPSSVRNFTVEVEIRDDSPTGNYSRSDYADVTISATNLETRRLSRSFYRRLYTDRVTSVTFERYHF